MGECWNIADSEGTSRLIIFGMMKESAGGAKLPLFDANRWKKRNTVR